MLSGQPPVPDQIDGTGEPSDAAPDDICFSVFGPTHERSPGNWFDVLKPKANPIGIAQIGVAPSSLLPPTDFSRNAEPLPLWVGNASCVQSSCAKACCSGRPNFLCLCSQLQ